MKKLILLSLLSCILSPIHALSASKAWQAYTFPARVPYSIVAAVGTGMSHVRHLHDFGLFLVGTAKLKDNGHIAYGDKSEVEDRSNRTVTFDENGTRTGMTYGTQTIRINTGTPPIRNIYHFFITRHPAWVHRMREIFLGYVATQIYYKLYEYLNYRYVEREREAAFKESVELYLPNAKIEEIARITNGLSNGDLQGIINKIKTYARCTPDCKVTAEIVDQAVREYVEKHQAFQQAHGK